MNSEPSLPVRVFSNFYSRERAAVLHDRLQQTVPWEQKELALFGKVNKLPRLTCWFGTASYAYSGVTNAPQPWTEDLLEVREDVARASNATYNSCLANWYRGGSDSVGWHADNEAELGPLPTIASVSLGVERTFRLRHVATGATRDFELGHGTLLVMYGTCQAEWVHCVPKRPRLEGSRINLTYRWFESSECIEQKRSKRLPYEAGQPPREGSDGEQPDI